MDEMRPYEVSIMLNYIDNADKTTWEQARMQMYITAQVNSTKKIKPTDIINFSWDKLNNQTQQTEISNADVERLRKRAEQIKKNIQ
jgi:hypothetical protein